MMGSRSLSGDEAFVIDWPWLNEGIRSIMFDEDRVEDRDS